MKNKLALTRFENFIQEPKIIGNKGFYKRRTFWLLLIPHLAFIFLSCFFFFSGNSLFGIIALIPLGLLWAAWYGPALDKSLKETVELGWWSIVHWLDTPILWLTSGSGFRFVLWPFGMYRMKQVLLNLPFGFDNINTGSSALAVYKTELEKKAFEKDPFNYYRLPISINGSVQLFPASIDFFDQIVEPSKWKKFLKTTSDEKVIEDFLREEIRKQVGPEIQSSIAKVIGKKTPVQIIAESGEIEELIEIELASTARKWGLQINAFQLMPLALAAEILDAFNKTVVAKFLKELKTLDGQAQRIYIREQQMGWAEALEAMRDKAGKEMYTIHEQYQTLTKGLETLSEAFKSGNHSLIVGENPVAQMLAAFSPALAGALRQVGPAK